MTAPWRAGAIGLDVATALCATLNLAYFLERLLSAPPETPARRLAVSVLSLVSLAALLEAVFFLAATSATGSEPLFASVQWTLVRGVAFAAAACLSALIVRRLTGSDPR